MDPLLTVIEAARLLKIAPHTLRGHVTASRIAYRRIGGAIRFTEQDLAEFIERSKVPIREPEDAPTPIRLGPMKWMKRAPTEQAPRRIERFESKRSRKAGR
jgi:excisionase family DNA binding protein